jgi:hypothetical protein
MHATNELDRLARVRPLVLEDTESVVARTEEDVLLRRILDTGFFDSPVAGVRSATSRSRARFVRRSVATATACVLLAALLTVASVTSSGDRVPTSVSRQAPSSSFATAPFMGQTIQLAGYSFRLPAGFSASRNACTSLARVHGASIPIEGSDPFASAASSEGGCIEAALAAGSRATIPSSAAPVAVGPYKGFVMSVSSTVTYLYVEIPSASGHHYLIVVSKGLHPQQLVAVAASGLPKSIGKLQTCAANCG